jgi:hypothetical protein
MKNGPSFHARFDLVRREPPRGAGAAARAEVRRGAERGEAVASAVCHAAHELGQRDLAQGADPAGGDEAAAPKGGRRAPAVLAPPRRRAPHPPRVRAPRRARRRAPPRVELRENTAGARGEHGEAASDEEHEDMRDREELRVVVRRGAGCSVRVAKDVRGSKSNCKHDSRKM